MKHSSFTVLLVFGLTKIAAAQNEIDLGPVTERHEMIPMRDGQRLSAYLYFPPGSGPWEEARVPRCQADAYDERMSRRSTLSNRSTWP